MSPARPTRLRQPSLPHPARAMMPPMPRWLALTLALTACDPGPTGDADAGTAGSVTILRDEYGVPHVFAGDAAGAAYGLGWTQAEDQQAAALAAIYVGSGEATRRMGCETCPASDRFSRAYGIPAAVEAGYDDLPQDVRVWIEGYTAGVVAYFAAQPSPPSTFDPADPPTARMVVASMLYGRAVHALSEMQRGIVESGGSNQLVVTGARTAPDTTVVLKDPHNAWQRAQAYAHVSIAGFDLFGNFGLGTMACGSNTELAFGCTRAGTTPGIRIEAELRSAGERAAEGTCPAAPSYEIFDHASSGFTPLEMYCEDVEGDGRWIYRSRFGPATGLGDDADGDGTPDTIVFTHLFAVADLAAVVYRTRMGHTRTVEEFTSLFAGPTPPEDAQYRAFGDRTHHIGGVLGATTPVLDPAIDWTQIASSADPRIDGWTSNLDWDDLGAARWHDIDGAPPELPHLRDPAGDYFLNCNGNPRFGTTPEGQIGDVPVYLERWQVPTIREVRMTELVRDASGLDLDAVATLATDVRVPHAPELVEAARCGVTTLGVDPVTEWGDGGALLEVLFAWGDAGYLATPDAVGATVAALLESIAPTLVYPDPGACLDRGQLDALAGVALRDNLAPHMRSTYADQPDPLRVPWGHLNYVLLGGREVGLPGMVIGRLTTLLPSSFTAGMGTGRADPNAEHGGSALLQITAYSDAGVEIRILPPYGQISDAVHPGSPHVGQTIDAYVARTPRRVWLTRDEIEAHLCPFADDPGHEHRARLELTPP